MRVGRVRRMSWHLVRTVFMTRRRVTTRLLRVHHVRFRLPNIGFRRTSLRVLLILLVVVIDVLLGGRRIPCVNHRRSRPSVLIPVLILGFVILLRLVRVLPRILWTGLSTRRRYLLLLLHVVRLVNLGKLLLHVKVQPLITGFVLLFVDFDTHNPFAVTARVVVSILRCW